MDTLAQLKTSLASRYVLEREIGRGGMATVYLARDVRHARNVAVKVLNPELGAVLGVERFLSEIQVTANLQHPNLLPLFDSGEVDGLLFYVMPYVEGESLRARLRREKQLPVDDALQLTIAVASALSYAHRHGVIHRDLKPENILLHEGQPLVADFGIALAVSAAGGERITQTGISLGTPHYMSPEQATGDRVVDQRSDIYSLAAVLYECLSGDPPHTASTAQAVIAKVLTDQPRSVRALRPLVPAHVEAALEKALEKLAADRWKTAQGFADALQGKTAMAGRARAARLPRIPMLPTSVAAIAGAAAAVAAIAFWPRTANREPGAESVHFRLDFPANTRLAQSTGAGRTLAISRDGRQIAYAGAGAATTLRRLVVRTLDDVNPRFLEGTEGGTHPTFSPDGRWVAFVADQQLKKVRVDGGAVQTLADIGQQFGIDWGWPDRIVVSVSDALALVSADGGTMQRFTKPWPRAGSMRWPRVLEDGKTIVVTMWSGAIQSAKLGVIGLDDGVVKPLDIGGTSALGVVDKHLVYATGAASIHAVPFDARRARVTGGSILVADRVAVGGTGAAGADVSSTGTLVYQSGSATSQLVAFDATGASRPLVAEARPYSQPRYSPDGRRIAVAIGGPTSTDIHIYDVASGTLTRLTTEGVVNDRAEWSADSKRVLYRSERENDLALWWQPADMSGPAEPLMRRKEKDLWEGLLAPDGKTLVYRTGTIGSANIFARRLTGDTTSWPLATTPFTEWCARVSPDSRWVAYGSDESRTMEVYVRPMTPGGGRVQVSSGRGSCPLWSRDGRTLYYSSTNQAFYAATVATSPSLAVTGRRKLFEGDFTDTPGHPNYDVGPRGEILMVKPTVNTDQVIVVHNWRAELRQRVNRGTSR